MKKAAALILTLLLVSCLVLPALAAPWRVFDNADLLTDAEEEQLEDTILSFQRATNMDIVFLSTDDFMGDDPMEVGKFFYNHGPYGFGADASGVLYYIDMLHRKHQIITTGKAIDPLSGDIDALLDASQPAITAGDYYTGIVTMVSGIQSILTAE